MEIRSPETAGPDCRGHLILIKSKRIQPEQKNTSSVITTQIANEPRILNRECGLFEVWALGIVIVVGGDFFSWNEGLSYGFGSVLISTFLIGTGYAALVLCTSETFSGLPFSGGAYGVVRCTFGFFPGFLIGCSEAIEYIAYVSIAAFSLVSLIGMMVTLDAVTFHLLLLSFYVVTALIHIFGNIFFWKFTTFLGVLTLLIVLIYCFGTLKWTSVKHIGVVNTQWFVGGARGFFSCLPFPSWYFIGVEALTFSSELTKSPKKNIPRAAVACLITLAFTGVFVLFVASSAPQGEEQLSQQGYPLNTGFSLIAGCSYQIASIFSIPAIFATAFGFVFAYSRLLCGLSESGLVPSIFSWKSSTGTPYAAIIIGCLVSYAICLLIVVFPKTKKCIAQLCFLSGFITYACQSAAYIWIKKNFRTIDCTFKSPLGIYGAFYSFTIFLLAAVSVSFFQSDGVVALPCLLVIWVLFSLYYFPVVKKKQRLSPEEQKSVFVVHTIRFNYKRSRRNTRPGKKGWISGTTALIRSVRPITCHFSKKECSGTVSRESSFKIFNRSLP